MKTLIVLKRINDTKFKLEFDDGSSCFLLDEEIVKYGFKEGQTFNFEKIQEAQHESDKKQAFNQALKTLGRSMKTKKEMQSKLLEKGFDENVIFYVIEKLEEYKYLNDESYIKSYIECNSKRKGKKLLRYELLNKGIGSDLIEIAFENFDVDNTETLSNLAEKYLKNKELNSKNFQKLYVFLFSKGYETGEISSVINNIKNDNAQYLI